MILTLWVHCFEFVAAAAVGTEVAVQFVVSAVGAAAAAVVVAAAAAVIVIDATGTFADSVAFADSCSLRAEPR